MDYRPVIAAALTGFLVRYVWEKTMVTTKSITISADPREKITVSLVGKNYVIKPPKGAMALQMARRAVAAEDDPE